MDEYDGDRFFTTLGGKGKTVATPLLLCLVCIELSDFVFAVDSIPAVLGVSQVSKHYRMNVDKRMSTGTVLHTVTRAEGESRVSRRRPECTIILRVIDSRSKPAILG